MTPIDQVTTPIGVAALCIVLLVVALLATGLVLKDRGGRDG